MGMGNPSAGLRTGSLGSLRFRGERPGASIFIDQVSFLPQRKWFPAVWRQPWAYEGGRKGCRCKRCPFDVVQGKYSVVMESW